MTKDLKIVPVEVVNQHSRYPVVIGPNSIETLKQLLEDRKPSKVAIITDEGIPDSLLNSILSKTGSPACFKTPQGEAAKTLEVTAQIWDFFKSNQIDKKSLIINLGGGAISDVGGFAASTYMRGIPFVHIPTTLLAQVDASIGGKLGINFGGIKNLIGTVSQPLTVIIDTKMLDYLPKNHLLSGFAEIIKHGLIRDRKYFDLVTSKPCSEWTAPELQEIIVRSCEIKKAVIEDDPTETGPRKLLNFGHTVGHALESYAISTELPVLHGEAVALGMIAETLIAKRAGIFPTYQEDLPEKLIRVGFSVQPGGPRVSWDVLYQLMLGDKKNSAGKIRWTLLKDIGDAGWDYEVSVELVKEVLQEIAYVA